MPKVLPSLDENLLLSARPTKVKEYSAKVTSEGSMHALYLENVSIHIKKVDSNLYIGSTQFSIESLTLGALCNLFNTKGIQAYLLEGVDESLPAFLIPDFENILTETSKMTIRPFPLKRLDRRQRGAVSSLKTEVKVLHTCLENGKPSLSFVENGKLFLQKDTEEAVTIIYKVISTDLIVSIRDTSLITNSKFIASKLLGDTNAN